MAIRGSCLCGGVRFEIDKAVGPLEICHCHRCRKVSGSIGMPGVAVNAADFRFLAGHDLVDAYDAPVLYQPPAYHATFCKRCGSPVPEPEPPEEVFEIAAGLFDDDLGIEPDKHIYVEHTPDWDTISDDLPQFTLREIYTHRTGNVLPDDFAPREHAADHSPENDAKDNP